MLELEKCTHPTVMADMCADCGADLRNEDAPRDSVAVASIPMVHSIPELKVNAEVSILSYLYVNLYVNFIEPLSQVLISSSILTMLLLKFSASSNFGQGR